MSLTAKYELNSNDSLVSGMNTEQDIEMSNHNNMDKNLLQQERDSILYPSYISRKIIQYLTVGICDTFKKRNPQYEYNPVHNPKRVLTKPSKPKKNNGHDNENSDLILYVHGMLGKEDDPKYKILDILGSGTFGQVVKCINTYTQQLVAVKLIKNKSAYTKQSLVEVNILQQLNSLHDPDDEHHILRLIESFTHKNHLCLVFELLSINLYELIKQNSFKGLSTSLVRVFATQLLEALQVVKRAGIIHCDLKPENVLLCNLNSPAIKIVDFGSACRQSEQTYTYIQSRFYRAPEVLLGLDYTTAIDMWSFGCIVAELYLGLPLFPGSSEYNQLSRITETLGDVPDYMIQDGKYSRKYYDCYEQHTDHSYYYHLKDIKKYSQERNKIEKPSKRYFSTFQLHELVLKYPFSKKHVSYSEKEKEMEMEARHSLLDFLQKSLQIDPLTRLTPDEAMQHPFITGSTTQLVDSKEMNEIISLGKKLQKSRFEKEKEEEEEVPLMLTGVRRKSFLHKERGACSVSPLTRKQKYGLVLSPLLSPPIEQEMVDKELQCIEQTSSYYGSNDTEDNSTSRNLYRRHHFK